MHVTVLDSQQCMGTTLNRQCKAAWWLKTCAKLELVGNNGLTRNHAEAQRLEYGQKSAMGRSFCHLLTFCTGTPCSSCPGRTGTPHQQIGQTPPTVVSTLFLHAVAYSSVKRERKKGPSIIISPRPPVDLLLVRLATMTSVNQMGNYYFYCISRRELSPHPYIMEESIKVANHST